MTNHEAVKVLKSWVECLTTDCDDDCEHCHIQLDGVNAVIEACAVAIMELSQPETDTVSRQTVLDAILQKPAWHNSDGSFYHSDDIKDAVNAVPPSPSRPKGHWIKEKMWSEGIGMGESYGFYYSCSECKTVVKGNYDECGKNFCPQCGADMRP